MHPILSGYVMNLWYMYRARINITFNMLKCYIERDFYLFLMFLYVFDFLSPNLFV